MNITRKQALATFVGGLLVSVGRRALANGAPSPAPTPSLPPQVTIDALTKRVAALEAALANQVAFTKDGGGNLTLNAPANVTINARVNLGLNGNAGVTVAGTIIRLN